MNWLKENWFKVGILIILLVAVLLGYLVFSKNPATNNISSPEQIEKELLSLKFKCQEVGRILDRETKEGVSHKTAFLESRYSYNSELNTCIYYGGYLTPESDGNLSRIEYVYDSLRNEELAGYSVIGGIENSSQSYFLQRKLELLSK